MKKYIIVSVHIFEIVARQLYFILANCSNNPFFTNYDDVA
jgi:hypothetical protein